MTERAGAFSDAIFAIAMTLLVLEIKPPPGDTDLLSSLSRLWPSLLAFAVSFLYIGIYWLNHHLWFIRIARLDGWLLLLNLVFLMTISFVSFPTALLAERLAGGHEVNIAVAFYGSAMLLVAAAAVLMFEYASRAPGLLAEGVDRGQLRKAARLNWLGPLTYAASVPIALALPNAALVFYVVCPVFFAIFAARDRGWSH